MIPGTVLITEARRPAPGMRLLSVLLLAATLGWRAGAMAAEETEQVGQVGETERWSVCTDSAVLPGQLLPIAARIAARVAQDSADVLVNVVPQDEGSAEFLLASTSEVFAQLRNALAARRVPYRRVNFQWRSVSGSVAEIEPALCRGVTVVVELSIGGS